MKASNVLLLALLAAGCGGASSNGSPRDPSAAETTDLVPRCYRTTMPSPEGELETTVCAEEDRLVMWAGEAFYDSILVEWGARSADGWRGTGTTGAGSFEIRMQRRDADVLLTAAGETISLETLSAEEEATARAQRNTLPNVEEICAATYPCLLAAMREHAERTNEEMPEVVPAGRTVRECLMQRGMAEQMAQASGFSLPDECN